MAGVRHQVGIAGDINTIFRAMSESGGLAGWWATTAEGTTKTGKVLDLHFSDVITLSFRIDALEENSRIQLYCISGPDPWQGCTLEFSFTQAAEQVWVGLVHENPAASTDDFLYFTTKWTCYLLSLRDLIESGTGCPYPNDIKIHVGD